MGIFGRRILGAVSIGTNLKALREARNLTQENLRDLSHVKQSDISKCENGQRPSVLKLLRFAAALGVPVDALVVGENTDYDNFRARRISSDEKIDDLLTSSVPSPGVSSGTAYGVHTRSLPEGHADAEAAPIRSPLDLAARLDKQAADIRASADAIVGLAERITKDFGDDAFGSPGAPTGRNPNRPQTPPKTDARPHRRRRGGER